MSGRGGGHADGTSHLLPELAEVCVGRLNLCLPLQADSPGDGIHEEWQMGTEESE